jgi:transcriptional regulator GlxA family with amidase domain
VLTRIPGTEVAWLGPEAGPVRADNGLQILAGAAYEEVPDPDVVVVPGGYGTDRGALEDERLVGWIRRAHETSDWTTSVCTGSELLGAAGLLDGLQATTYWNDMPMLRGYGAVPTERRVVEQGKIITAAGVSSGIDMALTLVARMTNDEVAKAIQLGIEYDPDPPFDSGSTRTASPETIELVKAAMAARDEAAA